MPDHEHGTRGRYLQGCTCDPCSTAHAVYMKRYRHRAHNAGGSLRKPAKRARAHLTAMREHYSITSLANLAGTSSSTVSRILKGKQHYLAADTERRLLAIRVGMSVGRNWVAAEPYARRVQALVAIGYGIQWQANELQYSKQPLLELVNGMKQYITGDVADRIRALYDRLHMTPRVGRDLHERGSITKALNMAAKNSWHVPFMWDDIDDPNERPEIRSRDGQDLVDPQVVERLMDGLDEPSSRAEKEAAMAQWMARGNSERSLCRMHGWKEGRYTPASAA